MIELELNQHLLSPYQCSYATTGNLPCPERPLSVEIAGNLHGHHQLRLEILNASTFLIDLAFEPALGEGDGICFVRWNSDIGRDAIGIDGVAWQPH